MERMMDRKKIQFSKYITAFAITLLVFIAGVTLGSYNDRKKLAIVDDLEQDIKMNTMGTEIQYLLMTDSPCTFVNSTQMAIELGNLGSKLTFMESQLGTDDKRVLELKEYYHLLELRHWLFLKNAKKECNKNFELMLYFYSNEGDCRDCEEQGHVLTYVHKKNPLFNIYSFDVNIDNPALNTLKERYNIRTTPTVVINETIHEGFMSTDEVMEALHLPKS